MPETITEPEYTKVMTEVKAYRVDMYCPNDGEVLSSLGYSHPMSPPVYPHICRTCGHRVSLDGLYPKIEYR